MQLLADTGDWTYFLLPEDEEASELGRALDAYAQGADGDGSAPLARFFDRIGEIEPYGPEDRLAPSLAEEIQVRGMGDSPMTVDVVVWPSDTPAEASRRVGDVRRTVEQLNGTVRGSDTRPQTTVVRAAVNTEGLEALLDLAAVEKVRLPLAPLLEPSTWLTAQHEDFPIPEALEVSIGVIDDGVAVDHPMLSGLVVSHEDIPNGRRWKDSGPHGTMVAGLAAYGGFEETLNGGGPLPRPVRLVVARVLEPDESGNVLSTHMPSDLPDHEVIEQAIRRMHSQHGVRIFNISVTDRHPFSGPHASVLTETIDGLVRELNIVVVLAAGNRPFPHSGLTPDGEHILHDYPRYLHDEEARLAEPAPAANALTVGSLGFSSATVTASGSSYVDHHAVAGPGRPSPFTRTGPGVAADVKPDLVHFGGDLGWNGTNVLPNDLGLSCVSLNNEHGARLFRVGSGTSFAAPRVANVAARVLARYPDASANLIRVLVALGAEQPEQLDDFEDTAHWRTVGFGIPEVHGTVESTSNRVAMVFEGGIAVNSALIHPVPIPQEFTRGRADRSIKIGLAYDPPVRRQRREYLAGRIKVDLFRNMSFDEVAEVVRRQDPAARNPLPTDRRRVQSRLKPGSTLLGGSTLQVRSWDAPAANSLSEDDGDTYYVALSHAGEGWAERMADDYSSQSYALAVELWDRDRVEVDLYNLVQQRVEVPARVRLSR